MEVPNIYFPNLGIGFRIDRVAFYFLGVAVYWYGIIMAVAVLAGTLLAGHIAKKEGLKKGLVMDYVLIALPLSFIGARLYYVLFRWHYYTRHWLEIGNIRQGGLAIYGAVITGVIVALLYTRYQRVSFLHFADVGVLGLLLGQAIGRYGNFINREAYGAGTDSLFAMAILKSSAKGPFTQRALQASTVFPQFGEHIYLQVHPTFLYESCWNLLLLMGLLLYRKHRKGYGELFWLYLIGYGIGRWWIEGLRTDQLLVWGTQLPVSQVIASLSVIMGIIGIIMCRMVKVRCKK